jgi:RNA recognition motif-containing protein
MATDDGAQKAVEQFHQFQMQGRALVVNEARPKGAGGDRSFGDGDRGGERGGYGGGGGHSRGEPRSDWRGDGASAARREYSRPPAKARDPFFDKPYEPSAQAEATSPSWEASARPATRSISANIKPKRKVAALFKSE